MLQKKRETRHSQKKLISLTGKTDPQSLCEFRPRGLVFLKENMSKRENTHRKITIINPESWGVKYNKTAQYYFQFRTDFLGNPQIATLSNGAKLLLLSILSESSRRVCGTVSYCLGFACGLLKVSLSEAKGFLKELERNEIIELDASVRVTKHNITEHNITEHQKSIPPVDEQSFVRAVEYLNEKCCRSFSSNSAATRKLLKNIFESQYGIDDIEAVIDFKKSEWGDNEKMENNLKPSVLFRLSNFEKYVDEAQEKKARVKKLLGE